MTLDEFFMGHEDSRRMFEAVNQAVAQTGPADVRVTKSQVAFRRRTGFASVWMPDMYLREGDVPLVLTVGLSRPDDSPRWKQVVESPGRLAALEAGRGAGAGAFHAPS